MSGAFLARAWSVARRDGMVLGFTDHDQPLTFDGLVFRPDAGLNAQSLVQVAGLAVDNTEAMGILSDDAITEIDLMSGRWDAAEVHLWEVDWTDSSKRRLIFRGHLGEVSRNGGAFRTELRGLCEPLNRVQGRVYHPRCGAILGDGACRMDLSRPGYQGEAAVISHKDGVRLILSGLSGHEPGWFERGRLEVLSGAATGLGGVIKNDEETAEGRVIELWSGLGIHPGQGDLLRLSAGCDKRAETCRLKFSNFLNFRGFPHLPTEDWLLAPHLIRAGST
ncbi:DUF2163 domain-containing protein [Paracoccus sp. (in: a-proteobacteria)]|uniref:DUF2163 domain-containing protein n=1 Tax=Paracoccus sp. TaxID=267 RepID=UPI0028A1C757|nr:DUF2163 domain-containing protein [Paracoccus sp. (in: a-proteobacteria)]